MTLTRTLNFKNVCKCLGPPLYLLYPCLSFLLSVSPQASLYKMSLEVAIQPAALRTVDSLPVSFMVKGMRTMFYWMALQPLLTEEHLTEFRIVVPSKLLG